MIARNRASISENESKHDPDEANWDAPQDRGSQRPSVQSLAGESEQHRREQHPRQSQDQRSPSGPGHEDHMRKLIAGLVILAFVAWPSSGWAQAPTQPVPGIVAGASMAHYFSAASTNSTNVKASQGNVYDVIGINTTATIYYLKLYDKATAPTCGTDTPVLTLPVPFGQSSSGGGFSITLPVGIGFKSGLGWCLTGAAADNDTTNAATGVVINFVYQ